MADFQITGLDDVMKEMMSHQAAAEVAIPEMLNAGAEILVKSQKRASAVDENSKYR